MPKHVTIRCYDPIARDKFARQPWSDVWLSFTAKPGRKKYCFAPTLVSKVALERFSNECGTTTKIVGAGLVPARVLMKLTGRD
jgi:hypothetical protein